MLIIFLNMICMCVTLKWQNVKGSDTENVLSEKNKIYISSLTLFVRYFGPRGQITFIFNAIHGIKLFKSHIYV